MTSYYISSSTLNIIGSSAERASISAHLICDPLFPCKSVFLYMPYQSQPALPFHFNKCNPQSPQCTTIYSEPSQSIHLLSVPRNPSAHSQSVVLNPGCTEWDILFAIPLAALLYGHQQHGKGFISIQDASYTLCPPSFNCNNVELGGKLVILF